MLRYALVSLNVSPSVLADRKEPVTSSSVMSVTTFSPMEAPAPMKLCYTVGVRMELDSAITAYINYL